MDEQRALLDQLMGTTRDLSDIQKDRVQKIRFSDHDVCKNYLCGLCPYVAFAATKSDMGKCAKRICNNIEAEKCKEAWNALPSKEKDRYGYERDLMHSLDNIVKSCDRKIDKQKHRTDQDLIISQEDAERIYFLYKQISNCLSLCEASVEDDDIDRIYEWMKQISQLQDTASKIANPPDEKRNIVCETSGNYMSSRDNDERMRAHFEGKQYLGWKLVREKLRDLQSARQMSTISKSYTVPATSSRGDRRDTMVYQDRERNRDQDRTRDRERERDRDRDRHREKGRESRGRRERDSDRGRGRERNREQERDHGEYRRLDRRHDKYQYSQSKRDCSDVLLSDRSLENAKRICTEKDCREEGEEVE